MERIEVDYHLKFDYGKAFGDWVIPMRGLLASAYMYNLLVFIHETYKTYGNNVIPRKEEIFTAFKGTSFLNTRVVILGGEPINTFRGTGLPFATRRLYQSSPDATTQLVAECIEKTTKKGLDLNFDCELSHWVKQGVLPLHSTLTTRLGKEGEDIEIWDRFTDGVIETINNKCKNVIFILLGNDARKRKKLICETKHYVLEYHHPHYTFSKGLGAWNSPVFVRANSILKSLGTPEIKW